MIVKKRVFQESNYKAFWFNGKTIRMSINPKEEIKELQYPEFYDVKITGYCEGKCPWCYMSSSISDTHYDNAVKKIENYFGSMTQNQRPFQVAIGGGDPTLHPEFIDILKVFKKLGVEPNYTTNGMYLNDEMLEVAKLYCGGVALSCHPHLRKYWESAAKRYIEKGIRLNFHLIISDKESIDYFNKIYNTWKEVIDYFVLLPYTSQGRAVEKSINWKYLISVLPDDTSSIAFGAGFYKYLLKGDHNIKVSLYEPEIMSKFLDLKDMKIYKSSFNLT